MSQQILTHTYDNGLVLLAEPMDWLESAAFAVLAPAGCSREPADQAGLSTFTCEMMQRGCGPRDSRQFVEDLENLGVDRTASASISHTSFGGATLGEYLFDALEIYADVLRRPRLPEDQLEEGRLICLQELRTVEDELAQKLIIELRRQQYPDPWGRSAYGTMDSLAEISMADIRGHLAANFGGRGTILGVAGKVDWQPLVDHVGRLLGDWPAPPDRKIEETASVRRYRHIHHDSSQTHIGIAYTSVPYRDKDYYQARGAVGVLSGGMSSRFFTEVREKRGLCYTVYAVCDSLRDHGSVLCYAGTSTDRAQETLDVMLAELNHLPEGIRQNELDRLKARIKSKLVLQQESSTARSALIAADWYYLGRVQTIDEIGRIIDGLTCESINAYLAEHPPGDYRIVTLGEKPLEVPVGVSSAAT